MKRTFVMFVAAFCALVLVPPADASHALKWHWPGDGPRTVVVVRSVTKGWRATIAEAASVWSDSEVIDLVIKKGKATKKVRKKCPAPDGKIRVCNYNYGRNGWAGLARMWINNANHLVKAKAKLNTRYTKTAHNKLTVACHELGHAIGLGHRDLGQPSCLTWRLGNHSAPDPHDFQELEDLYTDHQHAMAAHAGEEVTVQRDGPYRVVTVKILAHDH